MCVLYLHLLHRLLEDSLAHFVSSAVGQLQRIVDGDDLHRTTTIFIQRQWQKVRILDPPAAHARLAARRADGGRVRGGQQVLDLPQLHGLEERGVARRTHHLVINTTSTPNLVDAVGPLALADDADLGMVMLSLS